MNKGLLISFEGMEGAGKTTQCNLLKAKLEKINQSAVVVREPGGVPISEAIRDIVLSPKHQEITVQTEVLLFQAARAQLYGEVVLPNLQQGNIVLMDRTRDSSSVYQGIVRGIGLEWIEKLNDYSTQNTVPDLTFLFDLPPDISMYRRAQLGNMDRIEQEGVALQQKVRAAYLEFVRSDSHNRWIIIDALKTMEEIAAEVWQAVEKKLS